MATNPNRCVGFEQLANLTAAVGLSQGKHKVARYCIITAEGQNVRYRADGTDPTAAIGGLILANASLLWDADPATIKFIEVTPSAKINVHYFA